MAPSKGASKGSAGNQGNKNPHLRLVHGKFRFNGNTNVPVSHSNCQVSARAKLDKAHYNKFGNPPKVYTSNAKGMFHCAE